MFNTLFEIFDTNKIPISLLNNAYIDYELFYNEYFADVHFLDEGYDYTPRNDGSVVFSAYDTINELKTTYNLDDFQICVKNIDKTNEYFLLVEKMLEEVPDYISTKTALLVPNIKHNEKIIKSFMDDHGYFLSREYVRKDVLNRQWFIMVFDPKKQESIRDQVIQYYTHAYHTTPFLNKDSIEKYGIVPKKSYVPYITNERRVYLYLGNPNNAKYKQMLESISRKNSKGNPLFSGEFIEYKISIEKLPNDMEFFIDIHGYGPEYVYVTKTIPIIAIDSMKLKKY